MSVSEDVLDSARMKQMEERESQVDQCIRSNRYASAVQTALSNPPLGTKNADIKVSLFFLINLYLLISSLPNIVYIYVYTRTHASAHFVSRFLFRSSSFSTVWCYQLLPVAESQLCHCYESIKRCTRERR